jgi:hypothetical protein
MIKIKIRETHEKKNGKTDPKTGLTQQNRV